jgi:Ca2+-binding RTX toxin-like protein
MSTARSLWTKFRSVVLQSVSRATRKNILRRTLALEPLEARRVLSVSPTQVTVTDTNLVFYGSNSADAVTVSETSPGVINVLWESDGETLSRDFAKAQISKVFFFGREGDDTFTNATNLPARAEGEGGNDTLIGGSGADDFDGGVGNDLLNGGGGDDVVQGNIGNNWVHGGAGNDTVTGGDGDDVLTGGDGNDFIRAGEGADVIYGDQGNDRIFGDGGKDTLYGGDDDDDISAGDGNDSLIGGGGHDILKGELGDDTISGGAGNDTLYGHDGNDSLQGGDGADYLAGGTGNDALNGQGDGDRLFGEAGTDSLVGEGGNDELWGGDGNDRLSGGADNDFLAGEVGDDYVNGDAGDDTLYGHDGNDHMFGGLGNDFLRGGNGNDYLNSQSGDDTIYGDAGFDTLVGEAGADSLYGGDDADKLIGGAGRNTLLGDNGDDVLYGGDDYDVMYGGEGNDLLFAGGGADALRGGNGRDYMNGQSGDDTVYGDAGIDTLVGEVGNDSLYGGDDADKLIGGAGRNTLLGDNGDDLLYGGDEYDVIYGGEGNDQLFAGGGSDGLRGGNGHDYINGQSGDDAVYGDAGSDTLVGEDGADSLYGGDDADKIIGGGGSNILQGENGDDTIYGGDDYDVITGGEGNDQLFGGAGGDVVRGGGGNDYINGQAGDDRLFGDAGFDTLVGEDGNNELYGGDDDDKLIVTAGTNTLHGENGNDHLFGGSDADELAGGEGIDRLLGGAGNDVLRGGNGDDWLGGEEGDDYLFGEADNDVLVGGQGADSLDADVGNDLLVGDAGDDILKAGAGDDILIGGAGVDTLDGSVGEDLLIGGLVNHDPAMLEVLRAQWSNGAAYLDRVHAIEEETFAAFLQSEETVFDDYVPDSLVGGGDLDWFFVPGALSIYDPLGEHSSDHAGTSTGGHHGGAHVIDHLPVVEGFELLDSLDVIADANTGEKVHTRIPHADSVSKREEHLALFELIRYDQVTHYAMTSGDWSDPSIWHDGMVPIDGARVLIPIGVQVNVDNVLATEIATLRIDGTLSFATQIDTQLKVDTAVVSDVGTLIIGTESNPVAANVTAKLIFTDNGAIDRNWDPYGISRGLITHGAVQMYGAAKVSSLELTGTVRAGATVLSMAGLPAGWKVGDKVVIAGTSAGGNQSEERIIRAISGNSILVDALSYDHLTLSSAQSVHIANTTRNIILDSEASVTARRGHVMFMHNANVHISYAGFYKLGRTDKSIVVNDPVVDADWNLVPGTGTNPRARYAVHFHRTGTAATGNVATVHGSVVSDNTGWGFVNHSSNVDFTSNVAFNVTGAGFVTEVGDEIGSFRNNIAIDIKASGDDMEARLPQQDHGHTGDGFWFQGTGITVVNNVAANAEGHAFIYYARGLSFGGLKTQFLTSNLTDPSIANGATSILSDHVPVKEFSGNVGYSSGVGLTIWYNLRDATHTTQSVLKDSSFWNNETGVDVSYSHGIVLRNLDIERDFDSLGETGVNSNSVSKNITYDNLSVSGYHAGIDAAKRGYSLVNGGTFATRIGVLVRPATEPGRVVTVQGDFAMAAIPSEVLRPWTQMGVAHRYDDMAVNYSIQHIFYESKVVLNYGPYQNQQLYSTAQMPSAVLFPVAKSYIPSEYIGLTALQIKALYGVSVHGEFAPPTAQFLSNLGGLLQLLPL